jgi:hypothetical protein
MEQMKVGDVVKSFLIRDDDLVIRDGEMQMVDGTEETCQCVERALTTRQGEFFLDTEHGLNHEEFKKKNFSESTIKMEVIETVLQEETVEKVSGIEMNYDRINRSARIKLAGVLKTGTEIETEVNISS